MNSDNLSMSKFQLVTETRLPHRCISCGRSSDGKLKFLDFGLTLDAEDPLFVGVPDSALGVIYICENCGREAANVLGCLPAPVANRLGEQIKELQEALAERRLENEGLRTLVASYTSVIRSLGGSNPNNSGTTGEEQGSTVSPGTEQGSVEPSSK